MVIWYTVALSFSECLVSLMTSKCDSFVLGLKGKVLSFACRNPTMSKVAIIPLYSSPLLDLWARLNYPTTLTRLLTAVLAGVSFPDALTSPDGKLVSATSHQLKQLTSSTKHALSLRARRSKWDERMPVEHPTSKRWLWTGPLSSTFRNRVSPSDVWRTRLRLKSFRMLSKKTIFLLFALMFSHVNLATNVREQTM